VLGGHCADVGRDPADVRKSLTFRAVLDDDERTARERAAELYGDPLPERLQKMMVVGTAEQCVEELRPYADLGVGDFLLGQLAPVDQPTIELVAESVAPALKAAVAA
jgi:alkanesulfonate monooxygenase SsuD/methylene tetrahydromethanopterin reductase-like flavin-dependent oxidoreductase (luciferase family)